MQFPGVSLNAFANSCRWLSFYTHSFDYYVLFDTIKSRSIFFFHDNPEISAPLKLLRVLAFVPPPFFRRMQMHFGDFIFLRYISVAQWFEGLDYIVSINCNLQTLVVSGNESQAGASTVHLPSKIWKSPQLRHLELGNSYTVDPPRVNKKSFQTLSWVSPTYCRKEIYNKFPKLKALKIFLKEQLELNCTCGSCSNPIILDNLDYLEELEKLTISVSIDCNVTLRNRSMFPFILKKLRLSGLNLSERHLTVIGKLPWLKVLKLENSFHGKVWEVSEGGFCQLGFLLLEARNLEQLKANKYSFPRLQHLGLRFCYCLEEIPRSFAHIFMLQSIELKQCSPSVVAAAKQIREGLHPKKRWFENLDFLFDDFLPLLLGQLTSGPNVMEAVECITRSGFRTDAETRSGLFAGELVLSSPAPPVHQRTGFQNQSAELVPVRWRTGFEFAGELEPPVRRRRRTGFERWFQMQKEGEKEGAGVSLNEFANSCRWLSFYTHSFDYYVLFDTIKARSIFFFHENPEITVPLKLLRVLAFVPPPFFRRMQMHFGDFIFLRYISVAQWFEGLDYIVSISFNLQTLVVSGNESQAGASTVHLPSKIWESPQLRHLELGNSYTVDPPSINKKSFQTLSWVSPTYCRKEIYNKFPKLKALKIFLKDELELNCTCGSCSNPIILDNLGYLSGLEELTISVSIDCTVTLQNGSVFPFQLEKLTLQNGSVFPFQLEKLRLSGLNLSEWHLAVIGMLPQLKVLKLENSFHGKVWAVSGGGFRQLGFLFLEAKSLEQLKANKYSFPYLQHLGLRFCYCLKKIPQSFAHIYKLQSIELKQCSPSVVASAKQILEGLDPIQRRMFKVRSYIMLYS
nr:putative late blight resistance protein homolog R1A-4 [Ipomoea batatas]